MMKILITTLLFLISCNGTVYEDLIEASKELKIVGVHSTSIDQVSVAFSKEVEDKALELSCYSIDGLEISHVGRKKGSVIFLVTDDQLNIEYILSVRKIVSQNITFMGWESR